MKLKVLVIILCIISNNAFAKTKKVDNNLQCIVRTTVAEAENQSLTAKMGVMHTIHNRMLYYKKTSCNIVNRRNQFSHRRVRIGPEHQYLYNLAANILSGYVPDNTNGAFFFHDDSLKRNPFRRTIKTAKYDNMLFYRRRVG